MNTHFLSFPNRKVTLNVLIENETEGNYTATVLGLPECKAQGATQQQALTHLHDYVMARLAQAEIVPMEIETTGSTHPWLKLAGKFKDNPLFDEVLADMEAYRRELDTEMEAYYRKLDAEEDEAK